MSVYCASWLWLCHKLLPYETVYAVDYKNNLYYICIDNT